MRPHLLLALLASPCFAQVISPSTVSATIAGTSSDHVPFNGTARRYQQLHGDVGVLVIGKLSFRQNEGNTINFTGTRAIDMELFMANSSVGWASPDPAFASNYTSGKTLAIVRKVISFGPQGPNVASGGAPFQGMDLVLDAPFVAGTGASLVWEAVIYANALSGTFNALDADQSSTTVANPITTGAGCIATGRTSAMLHGLNCADVAGQLVFGPDVIFGPSSAPLALALGASNPNLAVPGLCSSLQTDLLVVITMPSTNVSGMVLADDGFWIAVPNPFAGAVIYSQLHALDAARADPIKVCNSSGLKTTVPTPNLTRKAQVSRVYNLVGGVTATRGRFEVTTGIGYGLVVRFS